MRRIIRNISSGLILYLVFVPGISHIPSDKNAFDKFDLWDHSTGPHLRGANIYQRRMYPELDGSFLGPGPIGPPYRQDDLDRLAEWGANYVNISHPGLFRENPPYKLDPVVRDHLDSLLEKIERADLYAVISFRTGPGRSEFTFFWGEDGDWFDAGYYNDRVWNDREAQDAWVEMWAYTAERYRDCPIVAGYDLMVEPNSNDVWFDLWEPQKFENLYGDSLYDWNTFYPRIVSAVRDKDSNTPILVGGMGYSSLAWMPWLEPCGNSRMVYTAHQYEPHRYTHQEPWGSNSYPGNFDLDWDGIPDNFDRAWLENRLAALVQYRNHHNVRVAVNEFGVIRWVAGAAEFMDDQIGWFESKGINYALWLWECAFQPYASDVDAFNFRHGPNPGRHSDVNSSKLMTVIRKYWERNVLRPSNSAKKRNKKTRLRRNP